MHSLRHNTLSRILANRRPTIAHTPKTTFSTSGENLDSPPDVLTLPKRKNCLLSSEYAHSLTCRKMTSSTSLPSAPSSSSRWEQIAKIKQNQRDDSVSQWAKQHLGATIPRLPPPNTKNVRSWPRQSGHLTERQLEITSSVPTMILNKIANKSWTAEEVFLAFSFNATIAHHLTNPFSDVFFEEGFERARELDQYLIREGRVIGPLHGLPMSLKDVMSLEGHATTLGFVALADDIQESSDDLVNRLYDAGTVFYCKTNVPQSLMSGECDNLLYGCTSTPDNRLLSAGGSSGGEGSLIALRGSPLGIGTDIAGSVRTPANFNGIYGLCPTYGRLPCHSAERSSIGLINGVAGPMSASIDGLELYTRTVLSFEPWNWDAICQPLPWNEELFSRTKRWAVEGSLCFGFASHDGIVRPHPPIQRGLRQAKEALIKAGHKTVDVELLDSKDEMWDTAVRIFCADGGKALRETLDLVPEPAIQGIIVPPPSMTLTASELEKESKTLLKIRQRFLKRWQDTIHVTKTGRPIDVLIMPSGGHVAPPHGTMEYFLYEAISNIIDWPCATIPVCNVDPLLDPKPSPGETPAPLSKEDLKNQEKYSPEAYENGAVCLQILGPRYSEEVVLASMRVVDAALGRGYEDLL
ncbi:putative amidase [Fusarium oxysporum f. sp. cubense]|uniref:amidase n=1 Tax=Fusarium oxysporum f. sp. cubense TaxID=61366 RepID=A0A559KX95_FUSOC|nr:putative amidase [Fusarium oxysporum f. sp. cubense]